jgi:hypothetical protein
VFAAQSQAGKSFTCISLSGSLAIGAENAGGFVDLAERAKSL